MEGEEPGQRNPVPSRLGPVTEAAFSGLVREGMPDQIAPGFGGLGAALLVRNLVYTLPRTVPLLLFTTDKNLTPLYHRLKDPVMGRLAEQYPMFYRGPSGAPKPLNSRGVSRRNPPVPRLFRAFRIEEIPLWVGEIRGMSCLYIVNDPAELPIERIARSHALLLGLACHR